MPSLDPSTDDPNAPARCPIRLPAGNSDGPRCRALILVRDALEHERWHAALEDMLTAPVHVDGGIEVVAWPEDGEPVDDEPDAGEAPRGPYSAGGL